jgi:26S proteasome regulatory subunit N5
MIYARIDRPNGIVSFVKNQEPNDILNTHATKVTHILELIEKTSHLINREEMVSRIMTTPN